MRVSGEIKNLLHDYDCVIIPELGGFVTNYRPARYDEARSIFHPPGKDISFNRSLKKSDGLLTSFISEKDSISFESASDLIKKEVEEYYTVLNRGERIEFERVGILYFDKSKSLRFHPYDQVNYLAEAFGLQSIYAPEIAKKAEQQAPAKSEEKTARVIPMAQEKPTSEKSTDQEQEKTETPAAGFPWGRVAAGAAVLVLGYAAFVMWRTDFKRPGQLTAAELNPFKPVESREYNATGDLEKMPSISPVDFSNREGTERWSLSQARQVEENGVAIRWSEAKSQVKSTSIPEASTEDPIEKYRHHIIGGCFSERDNANRYLAKLKRQGFQAYYLDQRNGLHRISMGGFVSRPEALASLKKIKAEDNASAWIVHR